MVDEERYGVVLDTVEGCWIENTKNTVTFLFVRLLVIVLLNFNNTALHVISC